MRFGFNFWTLGRKWEWDNAHLPLKGGVDGEIWIATQTTIIST